MRLSRFRQHHFAITTKLDADKRELFAGRIVYISGMRTRLVNCPASPWEAKSPAQQLQPADHAEAAAPLAVRAPAA
jgi:hypothetical protein